MAVPALNYTKEIEKILGSYENNEKSRGEPACVSNKIKATSLSRNWKNSLEELVYAIPYALSVKKLISDQHRFRVYIYRRLIKTFTLALAVPIKFQNKSAATTFPLMSCLS